MATRSQVAIAAASFIRRCGNPQWLDELNTNLYDTQVEYRTTAKLTLTAYLGYALGLGLMKTIYPHGKNGQLGYLELLYRF
ncbi:MAG: hypothetical protein JO336_15455 [Acidobacteriia bacterium]|nr:hypothetical protein [Terriglobia bacterium]MBV8903921.1 hypothetical protein [Terriglobia bacterium]MBV9746726.1 hypothetical protein [Terriglobia bacterium]